MTEILYQCFLSMELYGKEASQFDTINQMFLNFLKDHPSKDVVAAFEYYVQMKSRFPTVADILAILEGRVKLDKSYYTSLLKRRSAQDNLTTQDRDYIKQYEKQVREDWE